MDKGRNLVHLAIVVLIFLLGAGAVVSYLSINFSHGEKTFTVTGGACIASAAKCYITISNPFPSSQHATYVALTTNDSNSVIVRVLQGLELPASSLANLSVPLPSSVHPDAVLDYVVDFANGQSVSGILDVE